MMKFGHTENIEDIHFQLPPEDGRNSFKQRAEEGQLFVGCPVWANKDWVGKLYPRGSAAKDFLYHYSRQFNAIELNSTHYQIPTSEMIERWRGTIPEGFHFCPKFHQSISHDRSLREAQGLAKHFCETLMGLGDHLGTLLLQLPPRFSTREKGVLGKFLRELPQGLPIAVEFRNSEWFQNGALEEETFNFFHKQGVAAVITDVAGRRDVLHGSVTTDEVMIRFTGNGLHKTDYERAKAWAARTAQWLKQDLKRVYFFVHEPDDALAPEIGAFFIKEINSLLKKPLPEIDLTPRGTQMSLF